jgi:hypothetical protein
MLLLVIFFALPVWAEPNRLSGPWAWIHDLPGSRVVAIAPDEHGPDLDNVVCLVVENDPEEVLTWLEDGCRARGMEPIVDRKVVPGGDSRGTTHERLAQLHVFAGDRSLVAQVYRALMDNPVRQVAFPEPAPFFYLVIEGSSE